MNQAVTTTDDNAHAEFSPSGFARKALCPGSHNAEKQYPDRSNAAAIDGTHTHTLVEVCLTHGKKNANEYLDASLVDHEGEFKIDKDRIERANMALTYVQNQVKASAVNVQVTSEGKVYPGNLIFRDDWWGSCDIELLACEEGSADIQWINVIDYKDGAQPVDPYQNWQGISYMLGVIAKRNPSMDTPIRFTIIQPKAGGIKEWDTNVDALLNYWLGKAQSIINACEDPNAPFRPGEVQCQYCSRKKDCMVRQGSAIDGINNAMGNINLGGTMAATDKPIRTTLPTITEMTPENLSQVMSLAPIIRGWLKDIDEEALSRVKAGGVIPEYKLIQKNGRRSWEDDHAPIMKALLSMTANRERVFKKADIVEEKLISFAKILGNANLSDSQKGRIEKEFIKHPHGQKALVLRTEKGKDISPAAMLENMPAVEMREQ